MSNQYEKHDGHDTAVMLLEHEMACVLLAPDQAEASHYCRILEANGVPAVLGDEVYEEKGDANILPGFPVLVPENFEELAGEIGSVEASRADDPDGDDEPLDDEDEDEDSDLDDDDFDDDDDDDEDDDDPDDLG